MFCNIILFGHKNSNTKMNYLRQANTPTKSKYNRVCVNYINCCMADDRLAVAEPLAVAYRQTRRPSRSLSLTLLSRNNGRRKATAPRRQ